jgi:hypothetical protein
MSIKSIVVLILLSIASNSTAEPKVIAHYLDDLLTILLCSQHEDGRISGIHPEVCEGKRIEVLQRYYDSLGVHRVVFQLDGKVWSYRGNINGRIAEVSRDGLMLCMFRTPHEIIGPETWRCGSNSHFTDFITDKRK